MTDRFWMPSDYAKQDQVRHLEPRLIFLEKLDPATHVDPGHGAFEQIF